jgi:hypothetical protein
MPCSSGYEEIDKRREDAVTALLCGVMNRDSKAIELAAEWARHHNNSEEAESRHASGYHDRQRALEVLDRAYEALCK